MTNRRGMTLLEVVLALTIMASLAGLVATLWTQGARWTDERAGHARALRLARALELVRAQWAERRVSLRLDEQGASVQAEAGGVTFITTSAVLTPEWPIVRATYSVEPPPHVPATRRSLVYTEAPIIDPSAAQGRRRPDAGASTIPERPPEAPPIRRVVLLAGVENLRVERFGKAARVEAGEDRPAEPVTPAPGDAAAPAGPAIPPRSNATPEEKESRWRPIETSTARPPPALRLAGSFEEQEFACVLVVGDSR
jgi:prepilin-type N-terminal cleavage/methylation domain-containing protein